MKRRSVAAVIGGSLAGLTGWDLLQRRHTILRNYPIVGHLRFLLEAVGPELRQYIVTENRQERPFDRDQRRWIYASAKGLDNNFALGSDEDLDTTPGLIIVDHSMFALARPGPDEDHLPRLKVLGRSRQRAGMLWCRSGVPDRHRVLRMP
jgi:hypothetical protein